MYFSVPKSIMKPIPTDKENDAKLLLSQSLSIRKVAAQVGISVATVGRIAQKLPDRDSQQS